MSDMIAFFSLELTLDSSSLIGALLVTDDLGTPEEFRVTYPVKPTALQKQLYGDSLKPHIGVKLCGIPLFNALSSSPTLLILKNEEFLPIASSIQTHVAFVERLGETMVIREESNHDAAPRLSKIQSLSGRFQPLSVAFPLDYDEDKVAQTTQKIQDYFRGVDLIEPFSRIEGAVEALQEFDDRFR